MCGPRHGRLSPRGMLSPRAMLSPRCVLSLPSSTPPTHHAGRETQKSVAMMKKSIRGLLIAMTRNLACSQRRECDGRLRALAAVGGPRGRWSEFSSRQNRQSSGQEAQECCEVQEEKEEEDELNVAAGCYTAQPSLRPFASQTRGASHIAAHHAIPAVRTVAAHRAHLPHITLAGKLENQLQ